MTSEIEHLDSDFDKAEYLQNLLIGHSTGGSANNSDYSLLRKYFLDHPGAKNIVPRWVRVNRNLDQFWQFIKIKYSTYAERRTFIWEGFQPLLEFLESKQVFPAEKSISDSLNKFDSDGIHYAWSKALERKVSDPEGAITISRTILESVCKSILDAKKIKYKSKGIELSELYKLTAKELNLAPEQHGEQVFKQILGGCSGIVNGLGSLRNKLGDAHGHGQQKIKPAPRHAELSVNLSGTMALFLIETYKAMESK